jgi:hypothetical protein
MTSSLINADRSTHMKVVVTALVAASLVVLIGFTARVANTGLEMARAPSSAGVVKAGSPRSMSSGAAAIVR